MLWIYYPSEVFASAARQFPSLVARVRLRVASESCASRRENSCNALLKHNLRTLKKECLEASYKALEVLITI